MSQILRRKIHPKLPGPAQQFKSNSFQLALSKLSLYPRAAVFISRDRGWKENKWLFANFRKSILSVPTSVLFHFNRLNIGPSFKSLKLVFKQTVTDGVTCAVHQLSLHQIITNLLSHHWALGWRQKELRTTTSSSLLSDFSPQTTFSCRAKEFGGYSTISIGLVPQVLWSPLPPPRASIANRKK